MRAIVKRAAVPAATTTMRIMAATVTITTQTDPKEDLTRDQVEKTNSRVDKITREAVTMAVNSSNKELLVPPKVSIHIPETVRNSSDA